MPKSWPDKSPAVLTYVTIVLGLVAAILIGYTKLGGVLGSVTLVMWMAFPCLSCAGLAVAFQNHRKEGWIVFAGTLVCAFLGLRGYYAAFFSSEPGDPWKALMPVLYQMCVAVIFAGIAGFSFVYTKLKNRSLMKSSRAKT